MDSKKINKLRKYFFVQIILETAEKETSDLVMGGHVLSRIKCFIRGEPLTEFFATLHVQFS